MMAQYKTPMEIRLNAAVRVINSACELKKDGRIAKKRYDRIQRRKSRAAWWRDNKKFVFEYAIIFGCIAMACGFTYYMHLYHGALK